MKNDEKQVLLDVKNLKKYFNVGNKKILKAVDDISLQIYKGETLGLVGESGCGKSTFGRTVIHLYDPTDGTVTFDGTKIDKNLDTKQRHELCRRMQMIFQDPYASLNPRRKILDIVAEGIDAHGLAANKKERDAKVIELLETVGLQAEHADRFPHEFSGGQRQRVGIARALAVNPDIRGFNLMNDCFKLSITSFFGNKEAVLLFLIFLICQLVNTKIFGDRA